MNKKTEMETIDRCVAEMPTDFERELDLMISEGVVENNPFMYDGVVLSIRSHYGNPKSFVASQQIPANMSPHYLGEQPIGLTDDDLFAEQLAYTKMEEMIDKYKGIMDTMYILMDSPQL